MSTSTSQQPPQPSFIFRGHTSPIHALLFFASNLLLASGDRDGWIVIWRISSKRPICVWKAHEGGINGLKAWGAQSLISHGRDHKLRAWQIRENDMDGMSLRLPVDGAGAESARQPWLLSSLSVNALNYCAFAVCEHPLDVSSNQNEGPMSILIASANGLDAGGIDIFQLPSERRVSKLSSDTAISVGMVMAVSLIKSAAGQLILVSGYESGHVIVHLAEVDGNGPGPRWRKTFDAQPHTQPVLGLDANTEYFVSSAADARLVKFEIAEAIEPCGKAAKLTDTKHAGQQDLKIRDDGNILATAGWDKRVRVYSVKTLKELAVLKWHQEGCYAVDFASTNLSTTSRDATGHSEAVMRSSLQVLQDNRKEKEQNTHWLAAGGKDGKISLWDIY